jgi:hypothetical protein
MKFARTIALILALAAPALVDVPAARAADVVYPKGVRVGLVPLEGLLPAGNYPGFDATDQRVKVVVAELPKEAFTAVQNAVKSGQTNHPVIEPIELESGAKAFLTHETANDNGSPIRRFSLIVEGPGFSGYVAVQVPESGTSYSDEAVRKMLATTALRPSVPIAEQLDRLPFKLSDTAGFKSVRTLATGNTVLLSDATEDSQLETAPYVLIGLMPDGPATPDDRDRFAQEIARNLPGLRDIRITSSEPMRINSTPGFETRLEAVVGKENTPVRLVQWLRFGNTTTTLRIVASAPRDDWQPSFTRFRAVRDGIAPR